VIVETVTPNKVWTEEELMSLPDDGQKYELVEGELEMTRAGMEPGNIGLFLGGRLEIFVREAKLGLVCDSSTGFWMKSGNSRAPGVSFIAKERLQGVKRPSKKFFHGAPDLAVEILSPSDSVIKISQKIAEYFANGTRLAWVVNPEDETVLVYHSPPPDRILKAGDALDGEQIVPGFSLPVAELFAELDF
jgi:Uma2 family endonuclease